MLNLILALAFLTFGTMTYLLLAPSDEQIMIWRRVDDLRRRRGADPLKVEDEELSQPFSERVLRPIFEGLYGHIMKLAPLSLKDKIRRKLVHAGRPMDTARFIGIKAITASVGLFFGVTLFALGKTSGPIVTKILFPILFAYLGAFLPEFWLSKKVSERKKALGKALPDVLDLLSVSVEAGLGFDGAIQKVSEKFAEPISSEFALYLKEIRLGKSRADALRNLADRTDHPEYRTFTAAIIQADQLGASMARVLRLQSESMRVKRKQRAEERAMKAPIKMLFPLVMFIFPTLFLVILGPAVIHILRNYKM